MIPLSEVKAHLRVDDDDPTQDAVITALEAAAVEAAVAYLNRPLFVDQASRDAAVNAGSAPVQAMAMNGAIKAAILLQVGALFESREAVVPGGAKGVVELPLGVRYLLGLFRWLPGV